MEYLTQNAASFTMLIPLPDDKEVRTLRVIVRNAEDDLDLGGSTIDVNLIFDKLAADGSAFVTERLSIATGATPLSGATLEWGGGITPIANLDWVPTDLRNSQVELVINKPTANGFNTFVHFYWTRSSTDFD